MRDFQIGEVVTCAVLGITLLGVVALSWNRSMEQEGIRTVIREEVKTELDKRYRNVPRISINKVYTLQADGRNVAMETDGAGYGVETGNPY